MTVDSSERTAGTLDGKRVFVAGATGLVGSAIVRGLLSASPNVAVVGSYHSTARALVESKRLRYVRADLTTREGCAAAASGCDFAILAAAITGGAGQTRREPWRQVTDN